MSESIAKAIGTTVRQTAIACCWRQWAALNPLLASVSQKPLCSLIDVEALLLLSAFLMEEERRLTDVLAWWAITGAHLTSVQRLHSLTKRFPDRVDRGLGMVADAAYRSGDRRWRKGARQEETPATMRSGKGTDRPDLTSPAALWLRLRAGFGIGVKTDLLAVLIGRRGHPATIRHLEEATAYTPPALRIALQGMTQAGFAVMTPHRPATYRVDVNPWQILIGFEPSAQLTERDTSPDLPYWTTWHNLFAFLCDTLVWSEKVASEGLSAYLAASQARDIVEKYTAAFDETGLAVPEPTRYKGADYSRGFERTVQRVAEWVTARL